MKVLQLSSRLDNTKKNVSFRSVNFLEYNYQFNSIKPKLLSELNKFVEGQNNVSTLGAGKFGETFRFSDSGLRNIVIKQSKGEYKDDYSSEYKNLIQVPTKEVGGQSGVARAYNPKTNQYYLISTMAEGKEISPFNKYTDNHLKSLFKKMFELDKAGVYHGDLNGKNILLTKSGDINFIDYQWTQIVDKSDFFTHEKSQRLLLPVHIFPENAQMFEMATMPYYLENIGNAREKENFLRMYLRNKAEYHSNRYNQIKRQVADSPYYYNRHLVNKALEAEQAKAKVYRNPSDKVLKIELTKFQFLSDYRDAYSHVDPNMFDRNILASSSSYLCSLSAVQDYRKEIAKQMAVCTDRDMLMYLKTQMDYGDYWYENLKDFSSSTFDYVMRAITKRVNYDEEQYRFYDHERNPRLINENRNVIDAMDSRFHTVYDRNFHVPYNVEGSMHNIFSEPMDDIRHMTGFITDTKAYNRRKKIQHAYGELKKFYNEGKVLDLLNTSELITLKTREFRGYARHNIGKYDLNRLLDTMFERAIDFTENLYNSISRGLSEINAEQILVQGYKDMRKFMTKI